MLADGQTARTIGSFARLFSCQEHVGDMTGMGPGYMSAGEGELTPRRHPTERQIHMHLEGAVRGGGEG